MEDIALGSPSPCPTALGLIRPGGPAVLRLRAPASLGRVLGGDPGPRWLPCLPGCPVDCQMPALPSPPWGLGHPADRGILSFFRPLLKPPPPGISTFLSLPHRILAAVTCQVGLCSLK